MKDNTLSLLGQKIKEIRKQRGMSLQAVAEQSHVTAGLISKIENFRTIPSLPVLLNISRTLGVNMSELVSSVDREKTDYVLIRKGEAQLEEREDSEGLQYHALVATEISGIHLRVNLVTLAPNIYRKPLANDGMELVHVLQGTVTYGLPEKSLQLKQGDTLYFNGSLPHSVQNETDQPASLFKVYLMPRL